jgi:hypothetical protein
MDLYAWTIRMRACVASLGHTLRDELARAGEVLGSKGQLAVARIASASPRMAVVPLQTPCKWPCGDGPFKAVARVRIPFGASGG